MRLSHRASLGTAIIAATLPLAAAQARTPQVCGERSAMVAYLAEHYAEAPIASGLQADGQMLEVFHSAESGSWTILLSSPEGVSCLATSGEAWRTVSDEAVDEGPVF